MSFGESAENYHTIRNLHPYPEEIFSMVMKELSSLENITLLDLGCGTGIATQKLNALGINTVIGCDYDWDMLKKARMGTDIAITYVQGSARQISFYDSSFDCITSFGAFHWFCDDASVQEIKRILKQNGLFFVVNKNDASDFKKILFDVISSFTPIKSLSVKESYSPIEILTTHHFNSVNQKIIPMIEHYTLEQLIQLIQSMQFWNFIADDIKNDIVLELKQYFSRKLHNGYYERPMEINLVWGVHKK